MESAPRKRQRVEDLEENPAPISPVRSDIWFDDGSIVLQAETTQFRIYKGTLSSHSTVLKDLIANMKENKGVDGCPLLHLDDKAADVGIILRALTDRGSYPANEPLEFEVVAAFLRLGRKYGIKVLYDDGFSRLSIVFPSTVVDFTSGRWEPKRKKKLNFTTLYSDFAADVLLLARELSLLPILPVILYTLSQMVLLDPPRADTQHSILRLSRDDRDILLFSLMPLRAAHLEHLYTWLHSDPPVSEHCSQRAQCGKAKVELARDVWAPPLAGLFLSWWTRFDKRLCPECAAAGRKLHSAGREKLWQKLPSIYGLPPWEELLASMQ
ncbi:hypothetical protein C8J57DRAFT_1274861 [Mycena rebaudengoi]|nr:hypothetical protein C8J57DRAFT_1274861 [Mycena rebaudengoi]